MDSYSGKIYLHHQEKHKQVPVRVKCVNIALMTFVTISTLAGCDGTSTRATTKAELPNTPSENLNSVSPATASKYKQNTVTKFHLTNINVTSIPEKNSIVQSLKAVYPAKSLSSGEMTKITAGSLLIGDILSLSGGLIDKDHSSIVNIYNGASVVSIKNRFTDYVQDWENEGAATAIYGKDFCDKDFRMNTGYYVGCYKDDQGIYVYSNKYDMMTYLTEAELSGAYDKVYKPNQQHPFRALAYYMDSRYAVSARRQSGVCENTSLINMTDYNFSGVGPLLNDYNTGDAEAGTWVEQNQTYTNIMRIYTRDYQSSKSGCSDVGSYYRRIISHEVGHFLIGNTEAATNSRALMYYLTDCSANIVLPVNLDNRGPNDIKTEFSLVEPSSGTQRWIP